MDSTQIKHLGYDLERVIVYHDIRRAFNNRWNSVTLGLILLLGSGAFATVVADATFLSQYGIDQKLALACSSLLSAGLGFLQLVARFQERAGKHELVLKEYTDLLARYRDADLTDLAQIERLKSEYERVDSGFETNFRAVNMVSYNQVMQRKGLPEKPLTFWQTWLMNYRSFSRAKFG